MDQDGFQALTYISFQARTDCPVKTMLCFFLFFFMSYTNIKSKPKKTLRMVYIKLKICYQILQKKYKFTPSPVSFQVDYDRRLANPLIPVLLTSWGQCFFHLHPWKLGKPYDFWSFQGLEKRKIASKQVVHKHTVTNMFNLKCNGSAWWCNSNFMFILTHKITWII